MIGSGNQFLDFLFLVMIAFTLYKIVNIYKARKKIVKKIHTFPQRKRWFFIITSALLLMLGTIYIFIYPGIMGLIYILLGAYFVYIANEPIIFAEEGLYFNGNLDSWEDLGKWTFTEDKKYLNISFKKQGRDQVRILPVRTEDQERMHNIILRKKRK